MIKFKKIKEVECLVEEEDGNLTNVSMPFDQFVFHVGLARKDSGLWSEEACKSLYEASGITFGWGEDERESLYNGEE